MNKNDRNKIAESAFILYIAASLSMGCSSNIERDAQTKALTWKHLSLSTNIEGMPEMVDLWTDGPNIIQRISRDGAVVRETRCEGGAFIDNAFDIKYSIHNETLHLKACRSGAGGAMIGVPEAIAAGAYRVGVSLSFNGKPAKSFYLDGDEDSDGTVEIVVDAATNLPLKQAPVGAPDHRGTVLYSYRSHWEPSARPADLALDLTGWEWEKVVRLTTEEAAKEFNVAQIPTTLADRTFNIALKFHTSNMAQPTVMLAWEPGHQAPLMQVYKHYGYSSYQVGFNEETGDYVIEEDGYVLRIVAPDSAARFEAFRAFRPNLLSTLDQGSGKPGVTTR